MKERDSGHQQQLGVDTSTGIESGGPGVATEPSASAEGPASVLRRRPSLPLLIVANLGVFTAFWLILEALAQAFLPRDLHAVFDDPGFSLRAFVVRDSTRGFILKPGYDADGVRINSAGFRGPELPADLASVRIVLAMGESSTFGSGVAEEDSYPAQLQRLLSSSTMRDTFCVINAGVPSYTSPQVLLYLRQLLRRYQPRLVLISVLWNDALYACLDNWMPDYLVNQRPAPWRHFLLRYSAVYRACVIHSDSVVERLSVDNPRALRFYAKNLEQMIQECRRHNVEVAFVRPSIDASHVRSAGIRIGGGVVSKTALLELLGHFLTALQGVTTRYNVPLLDHRLVRATPDQSVLFIDPVHLTGDGNAILARDILRESESRGLLRGGKSRH